MFDKHALLIVAHDLNFISADENKVDLHVAAVAQTNHLIAEAALTRVSIDRPPQCYDVLRMQYVNAAKASR